MTNLAEQHLKSAHQQGIALNSPSSSCKMQILNYIISSLVLVSVLWARSVRAQCPMNTMTTFERVGGVTLKDTHMTLLYSVSNSTISSMMGFRETQATRLPGVPITAECNNRCRKSARCRAFLVDYARQLCYSIDQLPQTPGSQQHQSLQSISSLSSSNSNNQNNHVMLIGTHERTAYFEKHCFNLPSLDCERAWIFERVLGHQLIGHDDKIIEGVPSRIRCQEHCMNERDFKCRSGEYDYEAHQCRLSALDRHTQPRLFRQAPGLNVDYFENQCVNLGSQCDAFDKFDNMDLGRAEILRSANSSEQCQQLCTQVIKAFICRSFTWNPMTGKCYLSSANTFTAGGLERLLPAPGLTYYQRNDCFDLQLDCDHTAMTLNLRTNEPFRGRMYVRDDPMACETMGRSTLSSQLLIPFQSQARCAQRELVNRFSSIVVVQQHPLIQRRSDRYIKLVCDFQTANKTVTSTYNVVANPWTSTALINATSFAPKIRLRITDRFNNDVLGAKLGDELFLNIEAETESVYDMVARSVMAKSGGTESESIMLIDKDGCPTDPRIFPSLKKLNRRTIRGKFDAFKFSTDVVVRFQVDVQFCLNACPLTVCDPSSGGGGGGSSNGLLPTKADFANGLDTYSTGTLTSPAGTSTGGAASSIAPAAGQQNGDASFNSYGSTPMMHTQSPLEPYSAASPQQQQLINGNSNSNGNNNSNNTTRAPLAFGHDLQSSGPNVPNSIADLSPASTKFQPSRQLLQHPANQPANFSATNSQQQQQQPPMAIMQSDMLGQPVSDPQTFEARSATGNYLNSIAGNRRRRSVEPLPAVPAHVPLQGEIIIRDRDDPKPKMASADQQYEYQKTSNNNKQPRAQVGKRAGRGGGDQGPSYELNQAPATSEAEQTELTSKSGIPTTTTTTRQQRQADAQASNLLCTNRHSLVLAMLAFCAFQFFTIGLCLVAWLHKHQASRTGAFANANQHRFWLASNAVTQHKASPGMLDHHAGGKMRPAPGQHNYLASPASSNSSQFSNSQRYC